ncbi:MAG: hypothetical protein PVJ86_11050 [Phycisphaerales bacterium]|jgi:hypothetical protein
MRKLVNDVIQYSDAVDALKSPALAETFENSSFTLNLDTAHDVDCIGIGNTDATEITVNGETVTLSTTEKNGLYILTTALNTDTLTVSHDGTFLGRFGAGVNRFLGAAPSREPGFYTTQQPRITASGQVIPGAGGVSGKVIQLDFRYKIDEDIYQDFEDAYASQLSKGFPFFLYFDKETHRIPYERLYASTDNEILFQSSVNRFLYSRKFKYTERF